MDTRITDVSEQSFSDARREQREMDRLETHDADVVGRIIGRLCDEVGPDRYARYFDRQTRLSVHDDTLDVTVPTGFLADLLDRRFGASIRRAALAELRLASMKLCFKVDQCAFDEGASASASANERATQRAIENARANAEPSAAEPTHRAKATGVPGAGKSIERAESRAVVHAQHVAPVRLSQIDQARQAVAPLARATRPTRALHSGHALDDFIVGESNRLAHAAVLRLCDLEAGTGVSPLFIHGSCGLGKTHLLQGAARRFAALRPGAVVRFTTAEAFTNEYITAIRNGRVDAFRAAHRRVDLLAIDDVHFLSNKDATQGELLHTIDAAGLAGARLVLASDEHPREIRKLSAGLVSRFMAGGVVRLDAPDAELSRRLISMLAARRGLVLESEALAALAEHARHRAGPAGVSVRDLEGLVTQVEAVHRLLPEFSVGGEGTIGLALVRKAIGADAAPRVRRPVPLGVIADEVCRQLQVQMTDLTGKGRHKRVVLARAMITHLSRKLTTHSFPEIARAIGRPNHSTVITAHKRLAAQMAAGEMAQVDELGEPFVGVGLVLLAERLERDVVRAAGAA
ncbi:MAG: DnaA/Hda family protein [Planctomycetota bacterium]|nr:DnaA/Hda family protein [Planctomycetota bacterium]